MRRLTGIALALLLIFFADRRLEAQGPRPQFRPAVLTGGADSLINRIDAKALAAAGQEDGAIMFCARATRDGQLSDTHTYHGTVGTDALAAEVFKRLPGTRVSPAIYDHQPVEVLFYGTVVFSRNDDKPQVRIFLNQDPAELKKGSDFIGPQPIAGADSAFTGLHYPSGSEDRIAVSGTVGVSLKVDANGSLQDFKVLNEDPPLLGFGTAAEADFKGAKFIPAFRDGDADACDTAIALYYPTV